MICVILRYFVVVVKATSGSVALVMDDKIFYIMISLLAGYARLVEQGMPLFY